MNLNKSGGVYQAAMEASLAVAICVAAGVWSDNYFETSPGFLLVGLGIGFGSFITRLMRLTKGLNEANDGTAGSGKPIQGDDQRDE